MSDTRSPCVHRAALERERRASKDLDGAASGSRDDTTGWIADNPFATDCGEIAESGSGLGAFYAYQMAARSIERG